MAESNSINFKPCLRTNDGEKMTENRASLLKENSESENLPSIFNNGEPISWAKLFGTAHESDKFKLESHEDSKSHEDLLEFLGHETALSKLHLDPELPAPSRKGIEELDDTRIDLNLVLHFNHHGTDGDEDSAKSQNVTQSEKIAEKHSAQKIRRREGVIQLKETIISFFLPATARTEFFEPAINDLLAEHLQRLAKEDKKWARKREMAEFQIKRIVLFADAIRVNAMAKLQNAFTTFLKK